MKIANVNPVNNNSIEERFQAVIKKARNSGSDMKTTAELLAAIHDIGLRDVINCLDKIC